jgi:membrane carboxypeptidase/penicillin-binding protein PbpC
MAAAPILAEMAAALFKAAPPEPCPRPEGVTRGRVCSFSGMRPGLGCAFLVEEFFVSGTEPNRECSYHQPHSPWHRLDTSYADWLQQRHEKSAAGRFRLEGFDPDLQRLFRGKTTAAPPAAWTLPATRDSGEGSRVSIVYPLPGDRFLLAPRDEDLEVTLKAMCRHRLRQVSWFVNGREVGTVGPPYQLTVSLARGVHRLTALGQDGMGDTIEVSVQ